MACHTIVRELRRCMVRTCGRVEISLVTTIAVGRQSLIHTIFMTRFTRNSYVRSDKLKIGCGVIEGGGFPRNCRMACHTIVRELRRNVIRTCGCIEIRLVTAVAFGR